MANKRVWLMIGWLVAGCGQLLTPTVAPPPETVVQVATATAVATTPARPTATPRPVTLAPSPTVTPTPTPLIYTVQSGDTLLTIALAFETSTEALQELNGIVNPRFLQIGQELIIPASNVAAETPPTPTATPLPLGNPKILSNQ